MPEVVDAPPVNRTARSRAATRDLWRDRLARFPSSGLTVAQFCAIEAVSLPSFYFWKRRLAAEAQAATPQDQAGDHGPRLPGRLAAHPVALAIDLGGRRGPAQARRGGANRRADRAQDAGRR